MTKKVRIKITAELRLKFEAKLHSYSSNSDLQWISFDLVDVFVA